MHTGTRDITYRDSCHFHKGPQKAGFERRCYHQLDGILYDLTSNKTTVGIVQPIQRISVFLWDYQGIIENESRLIRHR